MARARLRAPFAAAVAQAGANVLPIIIESDSPALHALPWETLYHPNHGFLGQANGFTLLRRLPQTAVPLTPPPQGPLRVLLFTSLPDDLDGDSERLDVEEEQAQVLEALLPLIKAGIVLLDMPDDGRFSTLRTTLQRRKPHLVFLSGHGKFVNTPGQAEPPYAIFQFEDDHGHSDFVREETIADAFRGSGVGCLVLSACESGMGSSLDLNSGLAWRLSGLGLAHVIGMRESVLDRAGTLFVRTLCDELARQEPVDVAVQRGRQAITRPLADTPLLAAGSGLAEQSLGQWCLPMLISPNPRQPLLNWAFTPQPPAAPEASQTLNTVTLPPRFLGRRSELRTLKSRLSRGELRQLLLIGPGGQGKTALAGKLAQDAQQWHGYHVLAYSARPENRWADFEFELELLLTTANAEKYDRMLPRLGDDAERKADLLLRLLLPQFNHRLLLLLDNLEAVQDGATGELTNTTLRGWVAAAQRWTGQGLVLLLTSRWELPGWAEGDVWRLNRLTYGDFLRLGQELLPLPFLQRRDRLRQLYTTLHGNGRGLTFFASAAAGMDSAEEEAFLARLREKQAELQTNMAIAEIVGHLPPEPTALLHRLPAYQTPVPLEGVVRLGLELADPRASLRRLLAQSLVEQTANPAYQVVEYQLSPLVADWLAAAAGAQPDAGLLQAAADYLEYLFANERRTLDHARLLHQALRRAGATTRADRLALDVIVGPLTRRGRYQTLLTQWLPPICASEDAAVRAEGLNQTGKQHHHLGSFGAALPYLEQSLTIRQEIGDKAGEGATLNNISQIFKARGDYDTALTYLQQSLTICQEIGDKAGEGATLNNISQIYDARGDYDTALTYLQQSLTIQREIGDVAGLCATLFNMGHIHAQNGKLNEAVSAWVTAYHLAKPMQLANVLQALANLAPRVGLPSGLAGWEALAQRLGQSE